MKFNLFIVTALISLMPINSQAQSTKFVQWFDEYLPQKIDPDPKGNGWYRSQSAPYDLQKLDLDADGTANDALVWYPFSLTESLNPLAPTEGGRVWQTYREELPSARFYGGMLARFTNVSDIPNPNNADLPYFNRFQQATVQWDGGRPCCVAEDMPHNICRFFQGNQGRVNWFDMTVMVINEGGRCCPLSQAFLDRAEAEVNFTAVFIWKKADFINGGAGVDNITFNDTSRISVDVTRHRKNVEEARFIVLDDEGLWISEYASPVVEPETIALNPLNSRWAVYEPNQLKPETVADFLEQLDKKQTLSQGEQTLLIDEVNSMNFDANQAEFVDRTFTNVLGAGVYFATYDFSHQATQLVFDNFQLFAAGDVPPIASQALALGDQPLRDDSIYTTGFSGGIAVNGQAYERTVKQCVVDDISIRGTIKPDPQHIGKVADIVVVAAYKAARKNPDSERIFYMLDTNGTPLVWDGHLDKLAAFQADVTLGEQQEVQILNGKINLPGYLQVYFGYRLKEDGVLVYNPHSWDMKIYEEYDGN